MPPTTTTTTSAAKSFLPTSYYGRHFQLIGGAMFRSFRCLWMLEELGIPYEHVPALPQGKAIKATNPLGKIPALIERSASDGQSYFTMYESAAINTYLGDLVSKLEKKKDDNSVLIPPVGSKLRGIYEQTVSCIICELDSQGLWIHRKHESNGKYFGSIPEAVKHAKDQFDKTNIVLANQIRNNNSNNNAPNNNNNINNNNQQKYLVGTQFTAADILYVHCLDWSKVIGWDDQWKNDTELCTYYHTCQQRPAYQKINKIRTMELTKMMNKSKQQKQQQQQQPKSKL